VSTKVKLPDTLGNLRALSLPVGIGASILAFILAFTIGDNFNDYEMIRYAGIGVAMGDAPDGVKAIADWVAPSVEEDGVASAIEHCLLS